MIKVLLRAKIKLNGYLLFYLSLIGSPQLSLLVQFHNGYLVKVVDIIIVLCVIIDCKCKSEVESLRFCVAYS
jgi:hypothetical protein